MRKIRKNNNEDDNLHRWLISYSDFLTLLFTFFLALYALSTVDIVKATKLSGSLKEVFKVIDEPIPFEENPNKAIIEDLKKLLNDISGINVKSDARGIVITLPDALLFDSGSASIKPQAYDALTRIATKLKEIPGKVSIEGHTDNVPVSANSIYKSNWELSAARAASVLHFLLRFGFSPDRFVIAGYGEYRPVAPNDTEENRAKNRRVEIIILK